MRARAALAAVLVVASLALAGCTSSDKLSLDYGDGGGTAYDDNSGLPTLVKEADRADPVSFSEKTETGSTLSLDDYRGKVVVVNLWYATCAPCRAEAPILQGLYQKYQPDGVQFVGINVSDGAAQAVSFEKAHKVTYPSVLDVNSGVARLAFAKRLPPTATPTTYVLDAKGRVAARIVGELQSKSILDSLISDTLAEGR